MEKALGCAGDKVLTPTLMLTAAERRHLMFFFSGWKETTSIAQNRTSNRIISRGKIVSEDENGRKRHLVTMMLYSCKER